MPRKIVPQVVGERYHVFNRGVDKRVIFESKDDYVRFYMSLSLFNSVEPVTNFDQAQSIHRVERTNQRLVSIEAYALLPNHFHFIISPLVDGGLSEFMRRVCGGYTSYFNERYERSGALLQGTFKRVHISSDEQYRYLFAYVNENHAVHDVPLDLEICHTSSLYYQGKMKCRPITHSPIIERYSSDDAKLLARQIRDRRRGEKYSDLIE